MENYKEKLFQLLEQHLKDKEQADIKKICVMIEDKYITCLLYTSDAADEL